MRYLCVLFCQRPQPVLDQSEGIDAPAHVLALAQQLAHLGLDKARRQPRPDRLDRLLKPGHRNASFSSAAKQIAFF
jgi:hypothetical protein